ncbi:unnamed protein product [Penicillium manginii]
MPPTESARSALSSFTCTLCAKSYSRHPEYEAHIGSYDHQHRKRLQDLKQLSRDPNAAEKARRAERKADADAGLRVIDSGTPAVAEAVSFAPKAGGFKKGGFKSSFASVKGVVGPVKRNVLGEEEEDGIGEGKEELVEAEAGAVTAATAAGSRLVDGESDTDEEYARDLEGDGGYYDPRRPSGCFDGCAGLKEVKGLS